MIRERMLDRARSEPLDWDVIVIGGGATGLGVAVDAVSRGYRTILLEAHDFAKGTSSRSTKLIHGGVRYLRQGNVALVMEALRERSTVIRNAPHLVHELPFVVPVYDWWEGPFYGVGLKLYDLLAGRAGVTPSDSLSREETLALIPTLEPQGLRGGIRYYDAQFDDARMAVLLARTAADLGGCVLNYCEVTALLKEYGMTVGARVHDQESDVEFELRGRAVINATGVFSDRVRRMDAPDAAPILTTSQGVHIVLDRSFLRSDSAILVPSTSDGRVLFAVPWFDRVVVGTTDTPVARPSLEPRARADEIDYLLSYAAHYLSTDPTASDVRSVFTGLRPLVSRGTEETASISREHTILVSPSGLITITGGKWTTYRSMGEEAVDHAMEVGDLPVKRSASRELVIHGGAGSQGHAHDDAAYAGYGTDADAVRALEEEGPDLRTKLHPRLSYTGAHVVWAARHECALTVEDVLARRTRALFLDAAASSEAAESVARLLARERGKGDDWVARQVREFQSLCREYLLPGAVSVEPELSKR